MRGCLNAVKFSWHSLVSERLCSVQLLSYASELTSGSPSSGTDIKYQMRLKDFLIALSLQKTILTLKLCSQMVLTSQRVPKSNIVFPFTVSFVLIYVYISAYFFNSRILTCNVNIKQFKNCTFKLNCSVAFGQPYNMIWWKFYPLYKPIQPEWPY